jgi:hypothetical protein
MVFMHGHADSTGHHTEAMFALDDVVMDRLIEAMEEECYRFTHDSIQNGLYNSFVLRRRRNNLVYTYKLEGGYLF